MSAPPVMVLTYHSISPGPPPLCISARRFEAQLDLLARAGYEVLPLGDLVERLSAGGAFRCPTVVLSFDDGYADFVESALPILERRGLPATVFATASAERRRLSGGLDAALIPLAQLANLAPHGVEVGAHSVGHVDLTAVDDDALERELAGCRRALEQHTGRPVEHFAYPFGCVDARVRAAAARCFRSACTTRLALVPAGGDLFAIPRVDAYYLRSPVLRFLVENGRSTPYLRVRGWLRRLRGSEPAGRLSVPGRAGVH